MKHLLENHEVIIESEFQPIFNPADKNIKNGDILDHRDVVKNMFFYYYVDENRLVKVQVNKQMIHDLSERIKQIEFNIKPMPYDNGLPF